MTQFSIRHPERSEGSPYSHVYDVKFLWKAPCKKVYFEPMNDKQGYTYILANKHHNVFYVGVTSNLLQRMHQHRSFKIPGFTSKYRIHKLVYFEKYQLVVDAIQREKQIKGKTRAKKIALINTFNPTWIDLFLL